MAVTCLFVVLAGHSNSVVRRGRRLTYTHRQADIERYVYGLNEFILFLDLFLHTVPLHAACCGYAVDMLCVLCYIFVLRVRSVGATCGVISAMGFTLNLAFLCICTCLPQHAPARRMPTTDRILSC